MFELALDVLEHVVEFVLGLGQSIYHHVRIEHILLWAVAAVAVVLVILTSIPLASALAVSLFPSPAFLIFVVEAEVILVDVVLFKDGLALPGTQIVPAIHSAKEIIQLSALRSCKYQDLF